MRRTIIFFFCFYLSGQLLFAQDEADKDMMVKIRNEGLNHSQVMTIAHYLTDVAGPRLTNSPGYITASNWAVNKLRSWGLTNTYLDPWGKFGSGWSLQKSYIAMKKPYYHPLIAYPFAWTKGTSGILNADLLMINALDADTIMKYNYSVKGKIVLVKRGTPRIKSPFSVFASRLSDSTLMNMGDEDMITGEDITFIKNLVHKMNKATRLLQDKGAS